MQYLLFLVLLVCLSALLSAVEMSADLLYRVVALQCFDGSFNLDSTFCSAINVNFSVAQQGKN